jgi:hypothetical protein
MLKVFVNVTEIIGFLKVGAVYGKAPRSGAETQAK